MEKNVWVLSKDKKELFHIQQLLNATGALRTYCIFSNAILEKTMNVGEDEARPSAIIFDYANLSEEGINSIGRLQNDWKYAGIPIVFLTNELSVEEEERCYDRGAMYVLKKPMNKLSASRIERIAWQYEKTRNYEYILQKQANEITVAREIKELNEKLESRNELLRKVFGRYFSNDITDIILENPDGATIGGEKQDVTVMMADLRGFTAISESLSADVITDMINHFLEKMTEVIFEYNGSVIEFIGDAILAVFGTPIKSEFQDEYAISAAINMQNQMKSVNEYNRRMGYPRIEMGIGIHRGEVFVGNIGSEKMMRYNCLGGTVNLCSRIESSSVGGQILVSEETIRPIRHKIDVISTKEIMVKGISGKISVCDVRQINHKKLHTLKYTSDERFIPMKKELDVYLSIVDQKTISDELVKAKIVAMSKRFAIVEVEKADIFEQDTDVEIITSEISDGKHTKNSYAKVMKNQDGNLVLTFTYNSIIRD